MSRVNDYTYRSPLSGEILSHTILKPKLLILNGWQNSGDEKVFWVNQKENFKLNENENGIWEVYFSLEFTPTLIKNNLLYFEELEMLYFLLMNDNIKP